MNAVEALLVWHEVVEEPRLLCNRDGEVIWINSAAHTYAAQELSSNRHKNNTLGIWESTFAAGMFAQILEGAAKSQPNQTIKVQFDSPASRLSEAKIMPFSLELNNLIGITIPTAQRLSPSSYQALKANYGLTKTEFTIVCDILDGRSPSDTAEATNTSIFTVRTHIRNIYRKLNVSSRSSLLSRLNRYL